MICNRCRKILKSGDGIECFECESKYHVKCVNGTQDIMESGDFGYHWTCALCQHPAGKSNELPNSSTNLLAAINAVSEKFELVNKIQLPKLSNDLSQIRKITDRIEKQNEEIIRAIEEVRGRRDKAFANSPTNSYRRRHLTLKPKTKTLLDNNLQIPIQPSPDKLVRYRTRRRSNTLHKMFLLLNRKLGQTSVVSK